MSSKTASVVRSSFLSFFAGKGHEEIQIIRAEKRRFRDVEVSGEAISTHPNRERHRNGPMMRQRATSSGPADHSFL